MIFPLFAFAIVGVNLALSAEELAPENGDDPATASQAAASPDDNQLAIPRYSLYGHGNYMNALQICALVGMRLIIIDDQGKSDDVSYFVDKETPISGPFFISASRLIDNNTWAFHDGRPVKYFNWADGEPNNQGGNEKCIEIYKNGTWNDIDCSHNTYGLCEIVNH